jgi:hypothetical protein
MEHQPQLLEPANKSTHLGTGAKAGALLFTGANLMQPLFAKRLPKNNRVVSALASATYGGLVGGLVGSFIPKKEAAITPNLEHDKEIEHTMINKELNDVCQLVKKAADMTIPLEKKPVPEAGSEPVPGMTNNATANPASPGMQVYGSSVDAAALAKAKMKAQCVQAKTAAEVSDEYRHYSDRLSRDVGMQTALGMGLPVLAGGLAAAGRFKPAKGLYAAGALGGSFYGARGLYDAYKQMKARPKEKAAAAEEAKMLPAGKGGRQAAMEFLKKHKKALGGAGAAAAAGAALYAYNRKKEASAEEYDYDMDYVNKLASVEETGVTPDEAYAAAEYAMDVYNDAMEKIAFAEDLWNESDEYFNTLEALEKEAAEYAPIAGSTIGGALGATAGLLAAGKYLAPGNAAKAAIGGAALGAAVGGAVPSALQHFAASVR